MRIGTVFAGDKDACIQSRRNLINLYIIVQEAWDSGAFESNLNWLDAKEQELARLKAKHLKSYGEDVKVTVRNVEPAFCPRVAAKQNRS